VRVPELALGTTSQDCIPGLVTVMGMILVDPIIRTVARYTGTTPGVFRAAEEQYQ